MNMHKCSEAKRHVWTKWMAAFDVVRVKSLGSFDYTTDDHVWVQVRTCIYCNYQQARDVFHGKLVQTTSFGGK